MTKKPKKPRGGKYGFMEAYEDGRMSLKDIKHLHRWLGDCIRYIKYRQRKK